MLDPQNENLKEIVKEEKVEEEKTILVKMTPGQRPEVFFSGFWNGKLIKAAMNSKLWQKSICTMVQMQRYKMEILNIIYLQLIKT